MRPRFAKAARKVQSSTGYKCMKVPAHSAGTFARTLSLKAYCFRCGMYADGRALDAFFAGPYVGEVQVSPDIVVLTTL